ncbi:MAG TPA: cyclic nucleotide-binding and patatin-like phospholipase domain-containing protein [Burkholderiaceae bacterium]|nr:cyclic nucleotide-binding and patatin-like phospholipase domain-containing protein [Burkholderiaceae bacterium]
MSVTSSRYPHRDAQLVQQLHALLPDVGDDAIGYLSQHVRWVELAAGETLIRQGDIGDSAYLTISGRMRVYVAADEQPPRVVRELSRGEVIGEMSLYTGEPRSATVVAVRDSVLVQLAKAQFEELLLRFPKVSLAFTRQMIRRLQTEHLRHSVAAPVTVGILPISADVAVNDFAAQLAGELSRFGRVTSVSAESMDAALGVPGICARDDADADHRISLALDDLEARHDFVLLAGDGKPGPWTHRCVRNSDEMLLLADSTTPPQLHPTETSCLGGRSTGSEAAEILILLHTAETRIPHGTRDWLARRPVAGHVHLRRGLPRDMARLARLISRNAVGLVLAGGGARGFAHLGVWRALAARGIEVDVVGGTSIGALMGALVATDAPIDRAIGIARRAFSTNPTGDYNLLPLVSLIKGRRVRSAVHRAIGELAGGPVDVEDLWKGFFCIASNYSQAHEQRIDSGDLAQALLASAAIPGALPPVVRDGALLCDGGTFNNFPVDAMRELRGVGKVIGVDLGVRHARRLDIDEVPGSWALLLDRLRPRRRRRYHLPSLTAYLLNITILYSTSRQREVQRLTDVYLNPPLYRVGLLQWSRFDEIVRQGEEYAAGVIDGLPQDGSGAAGTRQVVTDAEAAHAQPG